MGAGHDDVSSVDSKEFSGLTLGSNPAAADAFLAWLLDFGERSPGHVLLPPSDDLAWLFAENREALAGRFQMIPTPLSTVEALLDKAEAAVKAAVPASATEDFALPTTSATDPWLASEFELFSGLPLDGGRNQCILTNANDERYPTSDEANGCSGFCRFPGDHTELGGVRRIHFENPLGNIVMRIPRVLRDFTKPYSDCHDLSRGAPTAATCSCKAFDPVTKLCAEDSILSWNEAVWSVPPDGYSVTFGVTGALTTYALPVQTAQRDISSGMLAQGLKSVTAGPSPYLYIVDEGRTGQLSGLRGQVMRIRGSSVDASFLLR